MFRLARIFALLLVSISIVAAAQSTPDPRDLVRRAAENGKANEKLAHDYIYVERIETHKRQGNEIKTESQTNEVFILYGERLKRRIEKNDNPLPEKEAAAEEERIAKLIAKRKGESESERQKRQVKFEKDEEQRRTYMDEIADAYNFTLVGSEAVNGRDAWVVTADPRPGYRPKLKQARFLPKLRMKAWIDKQETQVVRLEAEAIDDLTFGLFLVKVNRGAHLGFEATRINDEVWLPSHMDVTAGARMLFKHLDFDIDVRYRNYRKFRADSRILGVTEPQP